MSDNDLKIVELRGENIKRIKAIRFKPQENVTVISGPNENGKTSVLDIIWFALKGAEASKENPQPIHEGEQTAFAELDLGEYVVTRKFLPSGTTLEVRNKEGAKFPSPQAMLDKLIGSISLDPLAFLRYDAEKQRKLMMSFTNLTAALSKVDLEIKQTFEERAVSNKRLEQEVSLLSSMEDADIPEEVLAKRERIDISGLKKELSEAIEHNRRQDAHKSNLNRITNRILEVEKELEKLTAELAAEKKKGAVTVIPTADIMARIDSAEKHNGYVGQLESYEAQSAKCEDLHKQTNDLTEKLESLRQQKADAIKNADYPLEGLGISDDGITFNGTPFSQLSGAEKLKVSVAMAIAMQSRLKVIRITDGSLLDSKSMKIIEDMAKENGMQVFVERVDETGKIGIVIEDGEIAVNNYELPAPAPIKETKSAKIKTSKKKGEEG